MSFQQLADLAQIVASIGVIVSLIFVGLQIRHNTGALQRNEHNATMAQWTVIRMAIAKDRDIAELMTAGLHGERSMDARGHQFGNVAVFGDRHPDHRPLRHRGIVLVALKRARVVSDL